ncbi:unnamed protein product [Prorocentrum cordatum]|uniref:Uncharacterized protein n=1 Tax=Prorocentrum cordatum TaxID=2364126 RepID=A0ABN9VPN7_9DINO|nr:unnamed protein product [Polarella glacialis]
MPLSKLAWMAQEATEPAQKKQLTEALEELVVALAKLALTDEAELRSLIGAVHDTWLAPISAPIVEKALEENQAFNSEAQTQRELEKEAQRAGKPFDKVSMCAPFLKVFSALIFGACQPLNEGGKEPPKEAAACMKLWETVVAPCKDPNELHKYARFCKAKRVKTKNKNNQEHAKVQFLLDGTAEVASQVLSSLRAVLQAQGGTKTIGGAPRGVLVREAQRLLDTIK